MALPPPLPPTDYPVLLRRSSTWIPEAAGIPNSVVREARRLASEIASGAGRRDAISRYVVALGASQVGRVWLVARVPLFRTPGVLIADPARESFYWTLDPILPPEFERRASEVIAAALRSFAGASADGNGKNTAIAGGQSLL